MLDSAHGFLLDYDWRHNGFQNVRGSLLVSIVEVFLALDASFLVRSNVLGAVLANDAQIDVRSRRQVVKDSRSYSVGDESFAFFFLKS